MLEITKRLEGTSAAADALLDLPFELRQKSRLRARLSSGEDVSLMMPRGGILRGGDLLVASDARVVRVVAQPEALLHIECATVDGLARAAYHLGNRHVPVEVGAGYLRIAADHVLEHMLTGLEARVSAITAPFEPEAGAYAAHSHGAQHEGGARRGPARIHEYVALGHRHETSR